MPPLEQNQWAVPTQDPRGRCGSPAGYQAHRRRGERACEMCRQANAARTRAYKRGEKVASPPARAPQTADVAVVPAAQPAQPKPEVKKRAVGGYKGIPEDCPTPPPFLKKSGLQFWIEVTQGENYKPASLVLIGEAARSVDRLERISAALSNKNTFWFEVGDIDKATDAGVPIVVNAMIGEARQLQTTIRQTMNALDLLGKSKDNGQMSALDMLAQRRQQRMNETG